MIKVIFSLVGVCWLNIAWAQNKQIAAIRANYLHGTNRDGVRYPGADSITGKGMYLNFVDKAVSASHPEFGDRVVNYATGPAAAHSTKVVSIAAAAGIDPTVKGVAYEAFIRSYDANVLINGAEKLRPTFDFEDMFLANKPVAKHLVTIHSYGLNVAPSDFLTFGRYTRESQDLDSLTSKYPYWLPVVSAGNDGAVVNNMPHTTGTFDGLTFDKLPGGFQTAKNSLVVGNIDAYVLSSLGMLTQATINRLSTLGPTDDLRIKPEVYANGSGVDVATINKEYERGKIGTSYAAPAIGGAGILLQQYYYKHYKQYMRASTLKALLIHTAERITLPTGYLSPKPDAPDPFGGYGLVNVRQAAKAVGGTIPNASGIPEAIIYEGKIRRQEYNLSIPTKSGKQVKVSICWNDPRALSLSVAINAPGIKLTNDLELRVIATSQDGTVRMYPYSLYRTSDGKLACRSDVANAVDPYEFIDFIPVKNTAYSVNVSYKGRLVGDSQLYSLVITGLGKDEDEETPTCMQTRKIRADVKTNVFIAGSKGAVFSPKPRNLSVAGSVLQGNVIMLKLDCDKMQASSRRAAEEAVLLPIPTSREELSLVYPNPTAHSVTVQHTEVIRSISICTLDGKVVATYSGSESAQKELDISGLDNATYIVRVEGVNGTIRSAKLMKQP